MGSRCKKAILLVSFGTSHKDTKIKTLDIIRKDVEETYTEYEIYEAWTSKVIIAKVFKRDKIVINNIFRAMEQMKKDGITKVIIQPTYVINSLENEKMKKAVLEFKKDFVTIKFGAPLLTNERDKYVVMKAIEREFFPMGKNEALVLMGHGTKYHTNSIYEDLEFDFKENGLLNVFVGITGHNNIDTLLNKINGMEFDRICLAPLMIVVGNHGKNELLKDDSSWYNRFKAAGYKARYELKGLGEYKVIRDLFLTHIQEVVG